MIRYASTACIDLRHHTLYIAGHSGASVATSVIDRIEAGIELLDHFPRLGREGRVPETRELGIAKVPFKVVYRLDGNDVIIMRILHAAMQWPPENNP